MRDLCASGHCLHTRLHFTDFVSINLEAPKTERLRVPGLGPTSAQRILDLRRTHTFCTIQDLKKLGADATRAAPFILLIGKTPTRQSPLF